MIIRRLTNREQRIFFICVIIVIVYAGYNGCFKPLKEKIDRMDSRIAIEEKRLKRNLRTIQKAKASQKQYEEILSQFKQTNSDEEVLSTIIAQIEKVAGQFALQISNLKPKKVKEDEHFNHFSISLRIDSKFVNIIHFLYVLQSQPYLFNVDEIRFEKLSRRKSNSIRIQLVLTKILIP